MQPVPSSAPAPDAVPVPPAGATSAGVHLVVRVDRGAVLVVPVDDVTTEPRRAVVDRDGAAPLPDGTRSPLAVGDRVDLAVAGHELHVLAVHARRSVLVRDSAGRTSHEQVLAAGVDVVLVVEHLDPDPDLGRVERLLTLAWRSGARPVVVLTKADAVPDPAGMRHDVAAVAPGVDVHAVSVQEGTGLEPVRDLLAPGVVLVVVGPSGAGKSTLVNALAGAPVMTTSQVRADGRGRHTTTHRELVPLAGGAMLVDTPGIRGVGLVADAGGLAAAFADVAGLAQRCRFADCAHDAEPGCAVLAAVEHGDLPARRLDSWRRLEREAAHHARRADARLAALEHARVRRVQRARRRSPGNPRA
ncbi:ribosome small subunit-dependent GTPase A [Cellulomonas sp. SLBN-39]|uniref:ribosome small subunit-dependent GTPase A n=1 Tax=Cellulomonas sp. SLBN-39 TaxID=2768446 RepID=UPI00116BE949|nr:ribosome small subunit-dependent GTPase A [Cellulomonas sp. SLBN-39]TQL03041.1 ribosome biogenesis GTPase [Cellulomonas sp. SLBN-39]